ncbi:hypothetical protein AVEN_243398-1 [Araneus ventricosus]|uniref:Uncharacterized protein n=1 Tax=Araneus ventricosus TaxID=182803 RepID=A0A4Y2SFF0_ARAVE|nr:hypothetical protein AVEN_243398-1 [Araneus ventricosus]
MVLVSGFTGILFPPSWLGSTFHQIDDNHFVCLTSSSGLGQSILSEFQRIGRLRLPCLGVHRAGWGSASVLKGCSLGVLVFRFDWEVEGFPYHFLGCCIPRFNWGDQGAAFQFRMLWFCTLYGT